MGAAANVASTKQTQFRAAMMSLLAEEAGAKLINYADAELNAVGESVIFNEMGQSTAEDGGLDLFANANKGGSGATSKVQVDLGLVSIGDWLKKEDLLKTNVDLKGSYAKSFKRAIDRKLDEKFVAAIVAQDAKLTAAGDAAKTLKENFETLTAKISYLTALAEDNGDYAKVVVLMNRADYADLFGIPTFLSSDYTKMLGVGKVGLAGGEIIPTDAITKGTIYIVPAKVVKVAQWKGANDAFMNYVQEKTAYSVGVVSSIGAKLSDVSAPNIIKFSTKA